MSPTRGAALELCCGMGGVGLGLQSVGFDICSAFDNWQAATDVYAHNFPDANVTRSSLLTDRGFELVRKAARAVGGVELLAAGPPCKGVTRLRNGNHHESLAHNRMLSRLPAYVAALRPEFVFIENVPDLRAHSDGHTFRRLVERLAHPTSRVSYNVRVGVYDAALHGTPQARRRLFIVGRRGARSRLQIPDSDDDLWQLYRALRRGERVPVKYQSQARRFRDKECRDLVTAAQALSDLPRLGPGEPEALLRYQSQPKNAYQRYIRGRKQVVSGTQTPNVLPETIKKLRHVPAGGSAADIPARLRDGFRRRYSSAYRRLHPRAPATTLNTRYDCVYHFHEDRSLSVREYARLQGIPDAIEFPEDLICRRTAYELIGNSVPPPLVESILGSVLSG